MRLVCKNARWWLFGFGESKRFCKKANAKTVFALVEAFAFTVVRASFVAF